MADQPPPKGPYKLMTVNTVPARAKIIIGHVIEALRDRYTIDYVANSESMFFLVVALYHLFIFSLPPSSSFHSLPYHPFPNVTRLPIQAIQDAHQIATAHQPDILCCASMWTKSQSDEIRNIAHSVVPGIKTTAIPEGLQVAKGPDGVFE